MYSSIFLNAFHTHIHVLMQSGGGGGESLCFCCSSLSPAVVLPPAPLSRAVQVCAHGRMELSHSKWNRVVSEGRYEVSMYSHLLFAHWSICDWDQHLCSANKKKMITWLHVSSWSFWSFDLHNDFRQNDSHASLVSLICSSEVTFAVQRSPLSLSQLKRSRS